jgi:hypothetical protein
MGSLLPISARSSDDPIGGMWHVMFTTEGIGGTLPYETR